MKCRRIKQFEGLIKHFHLLPKNIKKSILKHLDCKSINLICEICINILKKNIPLKPEVLRKFRRHRHIIKRLVDKDTPLKRKKFVLNQRGSGFFLPLLFSAVAPLISKLIGL